MKIGETASIAARIEHAFQAASTTTGTSFDYLVRTARRESGFDIDAKAETSSASGLFQFIESTWLETVKDAGARHGLGQYADKIELTASGKPYVEDPDLRREILALRDNVEVASRLAGEFTRKNAEYLTATIGRAPSDGELYIAHFLGAHGAERLITLAESAPDTRADRIFSEQARANRAIFYNKDGSARTIDEVYGVLVRQHAPDATRLAAAREGHVSAPAAREEQFTDFALGFGAAPGDGNPASRVLSAWSATAEASSPFHALFQNRAQAVADGLGASFLDAYHVQEAAQETAFFGSAPAVSSADERSFSTLRPVGVPRSRPLAGLESGAGPYHQGAAVFVENVLGPTNAHASTLAQQPTKKPLNLTAFLRYEPYREPEEILPPI
ncbi:lytic transglycosylase domain-containing protein [Rhizobiales bacterium]|uniref:lytic transglycosylase domain-containing protein n=1 Tax=Hongsoonwoonella zoysiae TaxID=2821844 RepID=UPI001560209D|nr:lytic transglycosylase domain-containing protein [Hongsoonwoonella zoysiae]NRG18158.1 lytic transglycosylase domain-containing protein [Hongsoonwoonella zoysiae]